MEIADDGTKLTLTSEPWLIAKIMTVIFVVMSALFPLIVVVSLVRPPRMATIDCDRARGTCVFTRAAWKQSVSIPDLVEGSVVYRRGRKNSSASHTAVVRTRDGQRYEISEQSYHDDLTAGYRLAVAGLNGFLGDPARPAFTTSFVATDTDWVTMILFSLVSPLMAWLFLRLMVTRRIEVDRAGRTLGLVTRRVIGRAETATLALSEITGLRLVGESWVRVAVIARDSELEVLVLPRGSGQDPKVREAMRLLATTLAVPIDANDALRAAWGLK